LTSIISNPYSSIDWTTINQYKANLHTHTTESDGLFSVADTIDYYYNNDYKILAITDHSKYTFPWTDFGRNPSTLGMLAIAGNEVSGIDHLLSLLNDYSGWGSGGTETTLDTIESKEGLAVLAHPGRYDRSDEYYANLFNTYFNTVLIGHEAYNQGNRYTGDQSRWDRINSLLTPNKIAFGFSNDDMHVSNHLYRNFQFMLMDELTLSKFKTSMQNGAFYFCYEPGGSGDGKVPRITKVELLSGNTIIQITATDYTSITWTGELGIVLGTGTSIDISETDHKFVRATLQGSYGFSHTQPFTTDGGGYTPVPALGETISRKPYKYISNTSPGFKVNLGRFYHSINYQDPIYMIPIPSLIVTQVDEDIKLRWTVPKSDQVIEIQRRTESGEWETIVLLD
jgi:hypothetical protein